MDYAACFQRWDRAVEQMAEQARRESFAFAPPDRYLLYAAVRSQTAAFARSLPGGRDAAEDLLAFCFLDLRELCALLAPLDPELTVRRYFDYFRVRSGNPDTPDDRVDRLDEDRFLPYRRAREKMWRAEALISGEEALLRELPRAIAAWLLCEAEALRDRIR
ncbi:MAG: hypothetical protein GX418_13115 [Clostridiales bacterium]|nr:hypothetical protein [Clostridiales bacterium]